jgi:NAD(P) transhydrogenase subunit beta
MVGMAHRRAGHVLGPRVTPAGYAWIIGALVVGGSDRPVAAKKVQDDADAGAGRIDAQPRRSGRCLVGFASYIDPSIQRFVGAEKPFTRWRSTSAS